MEFPNRDEDDTLFSSKKQSAADFSTCNVDGLFVGIFLKSRAELISVLPQFRY